MGTRRNKKVSHTHKIMRIGPIWKCVNVDGSDCRFFVYLRQSYILIGRTIVCWNCNNTFSATEEALTEECPRCDTCKNPDIAEFDIDTILNQTK